MTATGLYETKPDRDSMWGSGAESGARETWDRFAEVLRDLQRKAAT